MWNDDDFEPVKALTRRPYMISPYFSGVVESRPSAMEVIAQNSPEVALHLARTLGRVKNRLEATQGAIAQARDAMQYAGAALVEEVHQHGIGARGIEVSAEAYGHHIQKQH